MTPPKLKFGLTPERVRELCRRRGYWPKDPPLTDKQVRCLVASRARNEKKLTLDKPAAGE